LHTENGDKMGRIRTKDIKNAGNEMVEKGGDRFTIDFETNKKQVNNYGLKTSKRVRNKLAGYITRHKRIEARH
jgi:small subunit ribosomal protein S17e